MCVGGWVGGPNAIFKSPSPLPPPPGGPVIPTGPSRGDSVRCPAGWLDRPGPTASCFTGGGGSDFLWPSPGFEGSWNLEGRNNRFRKVHYFHPKMLWMFSGGIRLLQILLCHRRHGFISCLGVRVQPNCELGWKRGPTGSLFASPAPPPFDLYSMSGYKGRQQGELPC